MSTITKEFTKEQLQQIIETDHVQCGEASALARIALASLEAEPAGWQVKKYGGNWVSIKKEDVDHYRFNEELPVREVYTAPPAPVAVPDALEDDIDSDDHPLLWSYNNGWNACRAAMLQGSDGNAQVIPDGWVLVPEEPTHEMLEAGDEQFGTYDVYRRMIAAALQQEVKP
ncbi:MULTISPECIES: hypothetical protein [Enterobacter cloacae complex]|uniref:hypothetical protein n=1 Tax=Enterobacter cloacae complex TaxID=354276 RepID=UPI0019D1421A|nr:MULTISPECIES: hypothetical protein [Enterobacter cloacae complex]MCO7417695.1 hypothetical protein [Enterobacter asburiae]UBM18383.1 hypothetical protein LBF07_20240 [Enterobacter cloacae complex sp. ECL352]HBK4846223.1 hypothetical protein [Enterobacter asburiae]HED1216226.1 hypothetical protein [Enterobacter asburiae]